MTRVIDMINPNSKVPGVSLLNIKRTEKLLGALFPNEYKELFLETNGAKFGDWTLFPIQTREEPSLTIDIVRRNADNQLKNVPRDIICIGEKMNGDKLCYRVRKRFMQEQIYLWNEKTGLSDCRALSLNGFIEWYGPKVNNHKPKEVGTFTVENGKLIVADPAYAANEEDLQIILSNEKLDSGKHLYPTCRMK